MRWRPPVCGSRQRRTSSILRSRRQRNVRIAHRAAGRAHAERCSQYQPFHLEEREPEMKNQHHQLITKTLAGAAIILGAWVAGAAPASADTSGTHPNPFGGPRCNCQELTPSGSPTLGDEGARGLRQGRSAGLPGLPPSTQPRGVHVTTLTNCISGLDC
jgi:hypothetical protein